MPIDLNHLTNALTSKAHGNSQVQELLSRYLAYAQQGTIGYAALVVGTPQKEMAAVRAGDVKLEPHILNGMDILHKEIETSVSNWRSPDHDPSLDKSYVMFNSVLGPHGFDFINWLVDAEMTRIQAGAPGPLKVGFWTGTPEYDMPADELGYKWHKNVFVPLVELFGFELSDVAIRGHHKPFYCLYDVVEMSEAGIPVPKLIKQTEGYKYPYITITLREMARWDYRNSNIPTWVKAAKYMKDKGENVIFVRDTAKADDKLGFWQTDPLSSKDLKARVALYENAKLNLFTGNGPCALAYYGSRPYRIFNPIAETNVADENSVTKRGWETMNKLPVGEQFPWANPDQRLVWEEPTLENIIKAYDEFTNT